MQTAQLEKIKKTIEASTMLQLAEKQQWLEMLPLMNDKQLLELETILNAPKTANQNTLAASQASVAAPAGARLSHISNLPTGMSGSALQKTITPAPTHAPAARAPEQPKVAPKPAPEPAPKPKPTPVPAQGTIKLAPTLNLSAAPATKPIIPNERPPQITIAKQVPENNSNQPKSAPLKTSPLITEQKSQSNNRTVTTNQENPLDDKDRKVAEFFGKSPTQAAKPLPKPDLNYRELVGGGPTAINILDDVRSVTAASLRVMHPEGLSSALNRLVKTEGYFEVWFALQESPLYKIYIHTGQEFMSGGHDQSVLSKEEFEALTDVFREIQIN